MKCNNYESQIIILIQAKQEHIFRIISTFIKTISMLTQRLY